MQPVLFLVTEENDYPMVCCGFNELHIQRQDGARGVDFRCHADPAQWTEQNRLGGSTLHQCLPNSIGMGGIKFGLGDV